MDFRSSEYNPTPRTAFTRIRGIADSIMNGLYNNYPEFIKAKKKVLMVNEGLIYWPLASGYLCAEDNSTTSRKCLQGNSQKTLLAMMKSLGSKGFYDGGSLPINKHGNPMFRK